MPISAMSVKMENFETFIRRANPLSKAVRALGSSRH